MAKKIKKKSAQLLEEGKNLRYQISFSKRESALFDKVAEEEDVSIFFKDLAQAFYEGRLVYVDQPATTVSPIQRRIHSNAQMTNTTTEVNINDRISDTRNIHSDISNNNNSVRHNPHEVDEKTRNNRNKLRALVNRR